jgi:hypothetical protein
MKIKFTHLIFTGLLLTTFSAKAEVAVVEVLMKTYQSQGASKGNASRGEVFWNKTFPGKAPNTERSCKTCHSANLKNTGKHINTGKVIKPLSPAVNSARLTEVAKVEKWFKRNCKWTTGNECSAQDKADILAFISQQ